MSNKTLTELGLKYSTDKATYHDFTDFYNEYLYPIKDEIKSLLEIGIHSGSSLRMWRDYFLNAQIYGIDIDPNTLFIEKRIITYDCSQIDFYKLDILFEKKSIDIIVDDGSHITSHQIKSFMHMSKFIKSGGFYILEDLHTSYMPSWIDSEFTAIEFLETLDKSIYNIDFINLFCHPYKESITSIIKFK